MTIDKTIFPVLKCIKQQELTQKFEESIYRQVDKTKERVDIFRSLTFFYNQHLHINTLSLAVHEYLLGNTELIKSKESLKNTDEETGLLLLPTVLYPDFSNVPEYVDAVPEEYPINSILYSWLAHNEHDKLSGSFDEEDPWERDEDRTLLILPIFHDATTQATIHSELTGYDEEYKWDYSDADGRAWYGKIQDYVMSLILLRNLNEHNSQHPTLIQETYLDETGNFIEILDIDKI